MEKEKKKKENIDVEGQSNKVVRINERESVSNRVSWNGSSSSNIIDDKKPGALTRLDMERTKANSLSHSKRQAHFLMEQLQSAKDELAAFRENHRSLLNQLFTVQKDYKNKIESMNQEKRMTTEEYKKLAASFRLKDKEFVGTAKKLNDLKDNYNKVQILYSEKISKFKNQYNMKVKEREKEISVVMAELKFNRQQAEKRADELAKTLADKNHNINTLKAKYEELVGVNSNLESSNSKKYAQADKLNSQIGEYQKKYNSMQTSLEAKTNSIKEMTVRIESLEEDNKDYNRKLEKYVLENRDIKIDAAKKDAEIRNILLENKTFKSIRDNRSDLLETINIYKFKEKELTNDVNSLKAEIDILNKDLSRQTKEADRYKGQAESLEQEKIMARKAFEDSQAKLQERLDILGQQKLRLEEDKETLSLSLEEYKEMLHEEKTARSKENEAHNTLSKKYESVTEENRDFKTTLEDTKVQNKVLSKKLIQAQTDIADVKIVVSNKNSEIQDLGAQLGDYERLRDRLQDEQISLEVQIVDLTEELKASRRENNSNVDQVSLLTTTITSLEKDIDSLRSDRMDLEKKISELNSVIETEQTKYSALEEELAKAVDEASEYKIREVEFVEREQSLKDAQDTLEFKVDALETDLATKEAALKESQGLCDDYLKQQRILSDEVEKIGQQNEALILKNRNLDEDKSFESQKHKDIMFEKTTLKTDLEDKTIRIAELNEKLAMHGEKEGRLHQEISSLKDEIKNILKSKDKVKEEFKLQIAQMDAKNDDLEKSIKAQKESYLDIEIKNQEYLRTIRRHESNNIDEKEKGREFFDKIGSLKEENQEISQKLEGKVKGFNDLSYEFEKTKSEMSVVNDKFKESQNEIQSLLRKNTELEERIESKHKLNEEIGRVNKQKKELEEEIESRNNQLNLYSRWVDSQKESLQKHVIRFAQELKSSAAVNPLKSYLSLTEKEINKVQTALAKQKLMGPQRTYMEQHYDQLVQQKTYINDLIVKSQVDVEKRVSEVMGLLKQGEFIPVPPLPPKPGK